MMCQLPGRSPKGLFMGLLAVLVAAGSAETRTVGSMRPAVPLAVTISLSKASLTFNAPLNGPNPPPQTVKLKNIGASALNWKTVVTTTSGGNWLTVNPGKGHRNPGQSKTVTVSVAMTTLAAGTYTGNIRFVQKNDATNFVDLPITLHVLGAPFIDVQPPTGLIFNAANPSGLQPTQTLTLSNLGAGLPMNWTVSTSVTTPAGGTWLKPVTPAGGTLGTGGSLPLTVTVDATGITTDGTYTGTVTITSTNASNSPVNIPITLVVTTAPFLVVSTQELDFTAPLGNPAPPFQTVAIRNGGGGSLTWSLGVEFGSAWLSLTPTSGSAILAGVTVDPAFQVSVDATGLAAGDYTDNIVITSNAANGLLGGSPSVPPFKIQVFLTVSDVPSMDVEPPTLTFDAPQGGPDPAIQTVTVSNQGSGTLEWTASILGASPWLSLNRTQDLTPGQPGVPKGGSDLVQVIVTVGSLAPGTYDDQIDFDDQNGTVLSVFVTLNVHAGPLMQLSSTSLSFDVPAGGAPSSQIVTLKNVGSGPPDLGWSASSGQSWLTVLPSAGSLIAGSSIDLTVTVDPSTLPVGSTVAQITVTSNAPNSPQIISVSVNANSAPKIQLTPTTLVFDVPVNGAAAQQTVTLQNVGGGPDLVFATSDNATWLDATPSSGSVPAGGSQLLTVTATPGSLAIGTYTGVVTVSSPAGPGQATNTPQQVSVTMNITDVPRIELTPASVVFNLSVGAPASSQPVTLKNVGGGPTALSFTVPAIPAPPAPTVPWLSAAPANGTVVSGGTTTLTITATPGANVAGTYTQTVRVNSSNADNAPQFISVTMNLTSLPRIGLNPSSLTFTTGAGNNPPNQTVTVTNTGGGTLNWSAVRAVNTPGGGTWLSLSPATSPSLTAGQNGSVDAIVTVAALPAGTYSGTITVSAGGATNNPQTIPVTLNVLGAPEIAVSPTSLTYSTPIGSTPAGQSVTVTNGGGTPLDWSAAAMVTTPAAGTWLKVPPGATGTGLAAGTSDTPFNVTIDMTGLSPGTYSGTVRITGGAGTVNSPVDIPVTLHVLSQPMIGLSPGALVFTVTLGAGNPLNQTVTVTNLGDLTLTWNAAASVTTPVAGTWLGLSPAVPGSSLTGGVSDSFDVTVDVTGLGAGTYTGTVTVTGAAGTTNTPQTIGVTLNINAPPSATGKVPRAGFCGSVGVDIAFPLVVLWAVRLWRRGRRPSARALSLLFVLVSSLAMDRSVRADDMPELPRSLAQEEPPPRPAAPPAPAQEEKPGADLFNFGDGSVTPHFGVLIFSSDFKSSAKFCGGLELQVPSPLFSSWFGSEPDRLGFFADVMASSVDRDVTAKDTSGTVLLISGGLFATFFRTPTFEAQAELGAEYGYFGGVAGLDNGIACVVGLRGALNLGGGFRAVLSPQLSIGNAGSRLYLVNAGLQIDF